MAADDRRDPLLRVGDRRCRPSIEHPCCHAAAVLLHEDVDLLRRSSGSSKPLAPSTASFLRKLREKPFSGVESFAGRPRCWPIGGLCASAPARKLTATRAPSGRRAALGYRDGVVGMPREAAADGATFQLDRFEW